MKRIGAHVSSAGGVWNAPINATVIGCKAFALFTKNQRQWTAPPFDASTIESFTTELKKAGYKPEHVLPHDSYLINLGNPSAESRKKARTAFIDELTRASQLGLIYLNMHPGSHLKEMNDEACCDVIAQEINMALDKTHGVTVVVEATAGQGSNVGYKFEHLAQILAGISDKTRIGVCIDTCHIFSAGYDIRTKKTYETTMDQFEKIIGFKYLRGVHLNDSKVELGSRVDRHHSLGEGFLGLEPFKMLMKDPRFEEIPLVLETIDDTIWQKEIELLYGFV